MGARLVPPARPYRPRRRSIVIDWDAAAEAAANLITGLAIGLFLAYLLAQGLSS